MTKKLVVNLEKCMASHRCPAVAVCPMDALHQEDERHAPAVNYNLCVACGACTRRCAKQALQIVEG